MQELADLDTSIAAAKAQLAQVREETTSLNKSLSSKRIVLASFTKKLHSTVQDTQKVTRARRTQSGAIKASAKKIKSVVKKPIVKETVVSMKKDAPTVLQRTNHGAKAVYFPANSSYIDPYFYPRLDEIATFAMNNPSAKIRICGYSYSAGTVEGQLMVSKNRADTVAKYLEGDGIPRSRLVINYAGAHRRPGSTARGSIRTRRAVEVYTEMP
jgi:outer membrane protein OmpA-like peptidoglycan-associated protein